MYMYSIYKKEGGCEIAGDKLKGYAVIFALVVIP